MARVDGCLLAAFIIVVLIVCFTVYKIAVLR